MAFLAFTGLVLAELQGKLNGLFTGITNLMVGIGVAAAIIGIVAGGLMRIFAFGNERRIAVSNIALSCAVVGLIIVFLGSAGAQFIAGFVK